MSFRRWFPNMPSPWSPTPEPQGIDQPGGGVAMELTESLAEPEAARVRSSAGKPTKRGVYLSDAVWLRARREAIYQGESASAVVERLLDEHLPHFDLARQE